MQPRLSKRQRILSDYFGVIRKEKYEVADLKKMTPENIALSIQGFVFRFKDGMLQPTPSTEDENTLVFYIGEEKRVFPVKDAWKFELWLIRRLIQARNMELLDIRSKLMVFYSIFSSKGIGFRWASRRAVLIRRELIEIQERLTKTLQKIDPILFVWLSGQFDDMHIQIYEWQKDHRQLAMKAKFDGDNVVIDRWRGKHPQEEVTFLEKEQLQKIRRSLKGFFDRERARKRKEREAREAEIARKIEANLRKERAKKAKRKTK